MDRSLKKTSFVPLVPMPPTQSVNFVERMDGTFKITQVSTEQISKLVGQNFQWTDSILMEQTLYNVYGSSIHDGNDTFVTFMEEARKTAENLGIMYINSIVGYGVVTLAPIKKDQAIGIYAGLYYKSPNDVDYIELTDNQNFEDLIHFKFDAMLILIFKNEQLFFINRALNKIIPVPIEPDNLEKLKKSLRPLSTVKTTIIGRLKNFKTVNTIIERDDYRIPGPFPGPFNGFISGKDYRNFLPFVAHGMPFSSPKEPSLKDFKPTDPNVDVETWRSKIVHENIIPCYLKYNDLYLPGYRAATDIPQYGILAFNYGIDYWYWGQNIPPALFTQEGEVIPPETYISSNRTSFFKPKNSGQESRGQVTAVALKT